MIARNEEPAERSRPIRSPDARRGGRSAASPENKTLEQIRDSWAASGHPALHAVEIELQDGKLVLRGSVPSFYLKQLAQHTALNVPGIQEIDNQLQVEPIHAE